MTLWTPDGERPISPSQEAAEPELTPEQQEQARQMAEQMAAARAEILEADPADIVANHAMGLYELAAIHITAEDPDLRAARLAVDAVAALVEQLGNRLDPHTATLQEALHQIRLAFVERSKALDEAASAEDSAD